MKRTIATTGIAIPIHHKIRCLLLIVRPHLWSFFRCSERLSERYEVLRRLHAGDRVQVAADVDANRADLREVTKTNPDVVRIVARELARADRAVNVATVVENHATEIVDEL